MKPACRPGGPLVKFGGGAGGGRAIPPVSRALTHRGLCTTFATATCRRLRPAAELEGVVVGSGLAAVAAVVVVVVMVMVVVVAAAVVVPLDQVDVVVVVVVEVVVEVVVVVVAVVLVPLGQVGAKA